MKIRMRRADIKYAVFFMLMLSMVLFPHDKYNIKLGMFFLFVIINADAILSMLRKRQKYNMIFFMIVPYPLITIIISAVMSGGDFSSAVRAVYVNFYLLIVYVCLRYEYDALKVLFQVLSVLVVIILGIAALDFLKMVDLYANPLVVFINDIGEGQISKSPNAIFYYVIFLNASPLLFFHFAYSAANKKYAWMALSWVAILFTGTRANVYLALAAVPVYVFFITKGRGKKLVLFLAIAAITALGTASFLEKVEIINFAKIRGDIIRGTISSSVRLAMKGNIFYWLFGMGYGSEYYLSGRASMVVTSELSYMEMLRTIGIFGMILFLAFLIYPVKRIFLSDKRWLLLPYGAMLAASLTDPFLYTSTSFVMYVVVYYIFYRMSDICSLDEDRKDRAAENECFIY